MLAKWRKYRRYFRKKVKFKKISRAKIFCNNYKTVQAIVEIRIWWINSAQTSKANNFKIKFRTNSVSKANIKALKMNCFQTIKMSLTVKISKITITIKQILIRSKLILATKILRSIIVTKNHMLRVNKKGNKSNFYNILKTQKAQIDNSPI